MSAAKVIRFPGSPPGITARVDKHEFNRRATRYGDLTGTQLTSVLAALDRGELEAWADLCEFAISTDSFLASVYRTRIDRVAQADYIVHPSEFGDQRVAGLAAEFISEQIERVENWSQFTRNALHGIFPGYSANEMNWERDRGRRVFYVNRIEYRHGHRFRMGPQYDVRLYDRGRRAGADRYGEVLDPRKWVVHMHQEQAGYPTVGGVMRSIVWPWLFRRWTEKGWILFVEKFGHPVVSASVPPNTPEIVRDQIRSDLENMSYDHVEVFEDGVNVKVDSTASQGSNDVHDKYMRAKREEISMAVLGVADAVEPGAHGSQAAVSTRAGVAMDPRMVSDGDAFSDTLRGSFIKQCFALNDCVRLFGVPAADIPLPYYRLKTADDEVVRDESDKAEELQAEASAGEAPIEVRGEDNDSMGADDVASMQGLVLAAARGELPPECVKLMLTTAFPRKSTDTWDAVLRPIKMSSIEVADPALAVVEKYKNGSLDREVAIQFLEDVLHLAPRVARGLIDQAASVAPADHAHETPIGATTFAPSIPGHRHELPTGEPTGEPVDVDGGHVHDIGGAMSGLQVTPDKPKKARQTAKADPRQLDIFPKALPPKRGTSGAGTTSRTPSGLPSPIELALRGELVGREFSSKKL